MKIAPIDIAHKNFSRRMMGLDQDEVMDFLRQIADEMEALIRDRNSLRESLREKELAILEYRERDELLKSTITTATKMSDKLQQDAEREARLILNDAKQQSEMIVRDARDSLRKIFQEITDLKRIRMQYENNLRALVQSHLTMMEQGHKVMPDPEINLNMTQEVHNQHVQTEIGPAIGTASGFIDAIKNNVSDAVRSSVRNLDIR
jgi:cell division initiation protein